MISKFLSLLKRLFPTYSKCDDLQEMFSDVHEDMSTYRLVADAEGFLMWRVVCEDLDLCAQEQIELFC